MTDAHFRPSSCPAVRLTCVLFHFRRVRAHGERLWRARAGRAGGAWSTWAFLRPWCTHLSSGQTCLHLPLRCPARAFALAKPTTPKIVAPFAATIVSALIWLLDDCGSRCVVHSVDLPHRVLVLYVVAVAVAVLVIIGGLLGRLLAIAGR